MIPTKRYFKEHYRAEFYQEAMEIKTGDDWDILVCNNNYLVINVNDKEYEFYLYA